jgi:hypothetical protein
MDVLAGDRKVLDYWESTLEKKMGGPYSRRHNDLQECILPVKENMR